jgi:hypothetical protein
MIFLKSNGNEVFVKALRNLRQIREATKLKFLQKLKQLSYEAFNAGKEINYCLSFIHRLADI